MSTAIAFTVVAGIWFSLGLIIRIDRWRRAL
jgi:hypothetical protein